MSQAEVVENSVWSLLNTTGRFGLLGGFLNGAIAGYQHFGPHTVFSTTEVKIRVQNGLIGFVIHSLSWFAAYQFRQRWVMGRVIEQPEIGTRQQEVFSIDDQRFWVITIDRCEKKPLN